MSDGADEESAGERRHGGVDAVERRGFHLHARVAADVPAHEVAQGSVDRTDRDLLTGAELGDVAGGERGRGVGAVGGPAGSAVTIEPFGSMTRWAVSSTRGSTLLAVLLSGGGPALMRFVNDCSRRCAHVGHEVRSGRGDDGDAEDAERSRDHGGHGERESEAEAHVSGGRRAE